MGGGWGAGAVLGCLGPAHGGFYFFGIKKNRALIITSTCASLFFLFGLPMRAPCFVCSLFFFDLESKN